MFLFNNFDLDFVATYSLLLIAVLSFRFIYNTRAPRAPIMINRRGGARIPFRRNPLVPPPDPHPPTPTTSYEVSPEDVTQVKDILAKSRNLPPELVDMIIDRAEYWACATTSINYPSHISVRGGRPGEDQFLLRTAPLGLKWTPASEDIWRVESEPKQLEQEYPPPELEKLVDPPMSTLENPFRRVVFDIVSRDQGWSGHHTDHGTYRSSFTWFDAGLERFDMNNNCSSTCPDQLNKGSSESSSSIPTCAIRPVWPSVVPSDGGAPGMRYHHETLPNEDHLIQRNKHAEKSWHHHHVEWSWDDNVDPSETDSPAVRELENAGRGMGTGNGEFVRNLKYGDMITVWGRARFLGWSNNIQRVEVKVYWAF
ncbi:hypothetical protein F4820DRAFT_423676 [Hypoxylon rubiginosum]|uniref:Uncharacterized protein n=1 Tax=Hypoxylon rubiginosum TaxID=110542 RepID=A0ACB9YZK7_9PEZI|nr:hypothetical protein F4820DRAFT_423676 [Hypoxylon rubiginosum]